MDKVKVYNVLLYDARNDERLVSKRMATREGAKFMCGTVLEETEVEIDDSQLEGGLWTPIGFTAPGRPA